MLAGITGRSAQQGEHDPGHGDEAGGLRRDGRQSGHALGNPARPSRNWEAQSRQILAAESGLPCAENGGADRIRTYDPHNAIVVAL